MSLLNNACEARSDVMSRYWSVSVLVQLLETSADSSPSVSIWFPTQHVDVITNTEV